MFLDGSSLLFKLCIQGQQVHPQSGSSSSLPDPAGLPVSGQRPPVSYSFSACSSISGLYSTVCYDRNGVSRTMREGMAQRTNGSNGSAHHGWKGDGKGKKMIP